MWILKRLLDCTILYANLLPRRVAVWHGKLFGFILRVIAFRKNNIIENINIVFPNQSQAESNKLIKKIYQHFGLLFMEILRIPNYNAKKYSNHITVEGYEENLKPAMEQGKGVALLTAHFGNWELAGIELLQIGVQHHPIVKEMKGELGMYLLKRLREKNDFVTIPRSSAVRDTFKYLKKGKIVTFLTDQNMKRGEGIFVDFFGKECNTMASLATITRRLKVPIIPAALFRNADLMSWTLKFLPAVEWIPADSPENEIKINTQKHNHVLEELIKSHPEQWIWMHRRWRTQEAKTNEK